MSYLVIGTFREDSLETFFSEALSKRGYTDKLDIGANWLVRYRMQIQNTVPSLWDLYCRLILIKNLGTKNYDVVFIIMRDLNPKFLNYIKNKYGHPKLVNLNPDQMTTLGRMYALSGEYDYVFMKDKYLLKRLTRIGVDNCYLWSECYPREWMNNLTSEEPTESVVIFGNIYYYRHLMIERLISCLPDVDIRVYGTPDRHVRSVKRNYLISPPIYGTVKRRIIGTACVVVNNLHFAEVESANNKFFEIVGCGGVVLNENNPEMSRLLTGNLKFLLWDNIDELADKILHLLNNKKERNILKNNLSEHLKEMMWDYDSQVESILSRITCNERQGRIDL